VLEYWSDNQTLLVDGLRATLHVVLVSLLLALPGGVLFGLLRCSRFALPRLVSRAFLEFYRALPMPFLLLAGFFLWPQITGIQLEGKVVAVGVFVIWGSVELGELIRGALESLPRSQAEAGRALGLNRTQIYRYVLLPQALPRMLPGGMNLVTRMVKTSCNVILVGVVDVVGRVQQINERTQDPLLGYVFLGVCFFGICFPITMLAKRLERRAGISQGGLA
jgi:polar amino acid transport system permease protein